MYSFGTVVLIPFPFTDLTSSKVRPALIVSKNNQKEDIIVCFITSQIQAEKTSNFFIHETDSFFEESGLKVSSTVRYDKIATLSKKIILGEIGKIPNDILQKQQNNFYKNFGF